METTDGNYFLVTERTSSYRTYEEWKPCCVAYHRYSEIGSYRTYEEWKLPFTKSSLFAFSGSYRTYEEWKQRYTSGEFSMSLGSYRTYEEWKRRHVAKSLPRDCVLTVPMRNGNAPNGKIYAIPYSGSYRTYEEWKLNVEFAYAWQVDGSYRTYEEWKQTATKRTYRNIPWVLTVPMRNGNHYHACPIVQDTSFLPYL